MTDVPAPSGSPGFPGRPLLIGTRSSPMALIQAGHVADRLRRAVPGLITRTVPTTTSGDTWPGSLTQAGGKGMFVRAIDRQLQRGEIDVAVHCLKDVPGDQPLPEGLVIAATPPRADVHDVLLVPAGSPVTSLADLPDGAAVATSAVRRRAQLLTLRPDLRMVDVRGTVATRLEKLDGLRGGLEADAMVLAEAGLERLGLTGRIRCRLPLDEVLPAAGAGVLALHCRREDEDVAALLSRIDDPRTHAEATAERSVLSGLRGHCNSPVAAHCVTAENGRLSLRARVFTLDGTRTVRAHQDAPSAAHAAGLGARVCAELLRQGARSVIDSASPGGAATADGGDDKDKGDGPRGH
ncbi:hydroxymethylbilane synthase [Streptomyces sp. WMMB 322]|uniref:hydroxymethylbilane synthase n=1 Tax=Streptomyces sp. WMMB 322 TaxID=1286821 RepID=UPI000823C309|nr:hydroxymethylbilane synthase [Streptomyces sp. WMMB 322]SCK14948.1 hydroxymethylbilane synthase [Streptomyces sp. WMMB 322]